MDNCYGQYGWREFHRNRKDILSEFDKILEQTVNRPIKVAHGIGVEAYLRKWLSEFLPKKYGVTSGYIIPSLYENNASVYHYDIIIYNLLESPVLWTEGNQDNSEQGKYRAIPAKHVVAVYEVKSRLTKDSVSDAFYKLNQTKFFADQFHPLYSCGVIFIELKESDKNRKSIIKELIKGKDIFGFSGGIVFRYEGDDTCTGLIEIGNIEPKEEYFEDNHYTPLAKPIDDLAIFMEEDGSLVSEEQGAGVKLVCTSKNTWSVSKNYGVFFFEGKKLMHLSWSKNNFSEFCINMLSALEGLPHFDERRPSFGQVFDNVKRKKAPLQSANPQEGKPFLILKVYEGGDHGEKLIINYDSEEPTISFLISVENQGDTTAILSDDFFRTDCELDVGNLAIKPISLKAIVKSSKKDLSHILKEEGLKIPCRLVYYPVDTEKEFCALEGTFKITDSGVELL